MKGPVIFDEERGSFHFNLPDEATEYGRDLARQLEQMFAYESMTKKTIKEMNTMAIDWLRARGIQCDWETDEETKHGN